MTYSNPDEIWKNLGKDAYTKVRSEVVGTGTGSSWELDHDNIITSSTIFYTNSGIVTSSAYTIDLDDGTITYTSSAALTLSADYDYGDLPNSIITQMISSSDSLIDLETGRNFTNQTGNVEYLNSEYGQKVFYLKNYPVNTLSSVEINTVGVTAVPTWSTSTAGLGYDYLANSDDLSIGRIRFIDNNPLEGEDSLRITYDAGYTTTPPLVNELSILLTMRNMANSAIYKSIFKGNDNFTPVRLAEIESRIEELKRILKKNSTSLI